MHSPEKQHAIDWIEANRAPTIKRRVTMAATKAGKAAKYVRSSENKLVFLVVQA